MKCLHSSTAGSCPLDSVEGSLYCQKHSNEIALRRNYLLDDEKLRESLEGKLGSNMIMSLREEVALLRVMIQDRLNLAKSDAERLVAYNQVGNWLGTLDKLVNSLNRLEKETSQVLTKETLMQVGRAIVSILSEEIKRLEGYEDVIDAVATRIVPVIEDAANCER